MPRNQIIVKFPTLNDKHGDVSKKWYVEYFYRVPGEDAPRKRRVSTGLCSGTAAQRYAIASQIIADVTKQLKSPDLLRMKPEDVRPVLKDDTTTRPEAERYARRETAIRVENIAAAYLGELRASVAQKTYETYKSKLKYFAQWVRETGIVCVNMTHEDAILFFRWLAEDRHLTRRSIGKYKQIVHSLYDWLRARGEVTDNPIRDIPNYGCIVDNAPMPLGKSDIERLRDAIRKDDPYLWLACEMQYYLALRPGQELRLLQVRDIDIQHKQIVVMAANAKNRSKAVVPVPDNLIEHILRLGIMNYAPDMYVFGKYNVPSRKPTGKNTLRERFNRYRDDLRIDKRVKFYSWKHTGAISMVENGASVWELQAHMRHSSITTTEDYIRQRAPQSRRAKDYIDEI